MSERGDREHQAGAHDGEAAAGLRPRRLGRRALMLGAAAGAGAALGVAAGAEPAAAATGGDVLLGKSNSATATTTVTTTKGSGLEGETSANGGSGVQGADTSAKGGTGLSGSSANGVGVYGNATGAGRIGVEGVNTSKTGGYGVSGSSPGGGYGVTGSSASGTGVYGTCTSGYGVFGASTNGTGVYGVTTGGDNSGAEGVDNSDAGGFGVTGTSTNGTGVFGTSTNETGVFGISANGDGVYGASTNGDALYADGNATVTGSLSKGGGSFRIDHPLDPAGKYLYHSFVESPDMMNVYNGTVMLDAQGRAVVELPDWFEALNRDFRYQLTAIGAPAPDLHIAAEVRGGSFSIAGGQAGQRVSWQLTGIRQDAWANAHRIPVEVDKPAEDQGRYLHPELWGNSEQQFITALTRRRRHLHRHPTTTIT